MTELSSRKKFVEEIHNILKKVSKEAKKYFNTDKQWKNTEWTSEIIKGMNKLAGEYSLECYPNDNDGEWLYDVTFWKSIIEREHCEIGIFSCVEIEWDSNDEGRDWDYQKVLTARTEIPIFITWVEKTKKM